MPFHHSRSFTAPALQFHRHTILTCCLRAAVELFTLLHSHSIARPTTFVFSQCSQIKKMFVFQHFLVQPVPAINSWHDDESKFFIFFFPLSCVFGWVTAQTWMVSCDLQSGLLEFGTTCLRTWSHFHPLKSILKTQPFYVILSKQRNWTESHFFKTEVRKCFTERRRLKKKKMRYIKTRTSKCSTSEVLKAHLFFSKLVFVLLTVRSINILLLIPLWNWG